MSLDPARPAVPGRSIGSRLPRPRVDPELWFRASYDTPLLLAGISDLSGRVLDANQRAVEDVGLARADVIGTLFWEGPWWGTDVQVRERVRALCVEAAERRTLVRAESRWWLPDGSERHVDLAIHPMPDASGESAYLFLSGLDITDRVQAQQAAAAAAAQAARRVQETVDERAESIRVLREAQAELANSLQLSQHILDNVADGIYGLAADLTANFANPSAVRIVGYSQRELLGQDLHALLHRCPDGSLGGPEQCFAARALTSARVVTSDRELFRRADGTLVPVEVVAVPTVTNGAVTGVVVSFRDLTERLAAEEQASQLRMLAHRQVVQGALSDRLQKALLTAPPTPPAVEIVVRYRPAAAEAQVGGDWYDAFVQPDGATMLVIGDVVGHDSSAAGAMAQLRGLLRGVAYGSQDSPAAILRRFDIAAQGLDVQTLATTVLARVDTTGDPVAGGRSRVVWSNAGHLPPVVLAADGTVTILRTTADLLLGIDPGGVRRNEEFDLPYGACLLLFTDGLIERRGADIDAGLDALSSALHDLGTGDLDEVCDAILARLLPRPGEDDVALLALRRR